MSIDEINNFNSIIKKSEINPLKAPQSQQNDVKQISAEQFRKLIQQEGLSVTMFCADWCGPCNDLISKFEKAADKNSDVHFYKIKIDGSEEMKLSDELNIEYIPTLVFHKDGQLVHQVTGSMSQEELLSLVQRHKASSEKELIPPSFNPARKSKEARASKDTSRRFNANQAIRPPLLTEPATSKTPITSSAVASASVDKSSPALNDKQILLDLVAPNGPWASANLNWSKDLPISQWRGVEVNAKNRITHIKLISAYSIQGNIPKELGLLSELKTLNLTDTCLEGSIPKELGQLKKLESLVLTRSYLSGTIPPELGQLKNLTYLSFNDNYLTGPIPAEIGKLQNLRTLNLNNNQLSGSIPKELGNSKSLKYLHLQANHLRGPIPEELGQLKLSELSLLGNDLKGYLPRALQDRYLKKELLIDENEEYRIEKN